MACWARIASGCARSPGPCSPGVPRGSLKGWLHKKDSGGIRTGIASDASGTMPLFCQALGQGNEGADGDAARALVGVGLGAAKVVDARDVQVRPGRAFGVAAQDARRANRASLAAAYSLEDIGYVAFNQ